MKYKKPPPRNPFRGGFLIFHPFWIIYLTLSRYTLVDSQSVWLTSTTTNLVFHIQKHVVLGLDLHNLGSITVILSHYLINQERSKISSLPRILCISNSNSLVIQRYQTQYDIQFSIYGIKNVLSSLLIKYVIYYSVPRLEYQWIHKGGKSFIN